MIVKINLRKVAEINNRKKYGILPNPGWPLGFYRISTTKKKTEYRPNIDHTALYRPNIDRKSSLKSAHLQYLLLSPEIYIFWENEAEIPRLNCP